MSYARKNIKSVWMSITGVVVLALIGLWQFYEFVSFESTNGNAALGGGNAHLWWAIVMVVFACIAGVLVFSIFLRHDTEDELHITAPPRAQPWVVKK